MSFLLPQIPPPLGSGLSWRVLWRSGAFTQLNLTWDTNFSRWAAERGLRLGIGQQQLQQDLAEVGLYPHAVHVVGEGKSEKDMVWRLVEGLLGPGSADELGFTDLGGSGRAAYIGTEAASALTMHLSKLAAYGAGDLLTSRVLLYGATLTPATLLGVRAGNTIVGRISDRLFVLLVEIGLLVAGVLFLTGL